MNWLIRRLLDCRLLICPALRSSGTCPDQSAIGNLQSTIDRDLSLSFRRLVQPRRLPAFGTFIQPTSPSTGPLLFNTCARRCGARLWILWSGDGPPPEPLELYYARSSGAGIVGQLYDFVNQGRREVAALRRR